MAGIAGNAEENDEKPREEVVGRVGTFERVDDLPYHCALGGTPVAIAKPGPRHVLASRGHEPQHAAAGETVELLDRAGEEPKLEWERMFRPSDHGGGGADIVVGKSIHLPRVRIEAEGEAMQEGRSQKTRAVLTGIEWAAAVEERPRRKKPGHRIVIDPLAREARARVRCYDREPAKPALRRKDRGVATAISFQGVVKVRQCWARSHRLQ